MLYSLSWLIPWRLNLYADISDHSLFHIHRWCMQKSAYTTYEDGTECSETSARKIQTPGNTPE